MIILLFVCALFIRVAGSQERHICATSHRNPNQHRERIQKCMDHLFRVCTKAADDIKHLVDDGTGTQKTVKEDQCSKSVAALLLNDDELAYQMIMEKYDFEADYYDLISFAHGYIGYYVRESKKDHSKVMPKICPKYTMKACRPLITFCEKNLRRYAFCSDTFIPYKEYLQCYFTPSEAKANCGMVCDKVLTKKLFGIEKTDDVYCKRGKERCENIETAELIPECEGHFKAQCDVNDADTYSKCEQAIRNMKLAPQLLPSTLSSHKCNDPSSRLICFDYLKLMGEGKMASQFVKSECSKQPKPEICNVLEEYCGNGNLTLPVDPPECKPQAEEVMTSTSVPHTQSYHINTTLISTTHNRQTEQRISYVFLSSLLLLI